VEILKDWLRDTIEGWNRHPTPFIWGGKRHARRDRAYARRHRQGGSGATTQYIPHAAFVRCAITDGSAIPLQMASDPLGCVLLL
jgi:hypothetical protein